MKKTKDSNLIIPDTNVLISDPDAILKMINGSSNLVVLPLTVLTELDKLKRDLRIGKDVSRAINAIEQFVIAGNENFVIVKETDYSGLNIDTAKADHQILATFNYVLNSDKYQGYAKYKLVTDDTNMRLIAHGVFAESENIIIEKYKAIIVENTKSQKLPIISISKKNVTVKVDYDKEIFGKINENGGILMNFGEEQKNGDTSSQLLGIRKGEKIEIIKSDLNLFGLRPVHKEEINWLQLLAMSQLTDDGIHCIFLQGPAGTGKTLLALAAALEQKYKFEQLLLVSPMVPLSKQDRLGFLPGDMKEKSAPWLISFSQNIHFLEMKQYEKIKKLLDAENKGKSRKNSEETYTLSNLWEKYGFICQPLEYIRGQSIANAFIIIDEAQNLTQHEIKTIITRAGDNSKLVFCGDLSQIDLPYLSRETSGLTYGIERLSGVEYKNKMIAVTTFDTPVRSKLSAFASEVL